MTNITYVGNIHVKMEFNVGIDTSNIDINNSYIAMRRSDGSKINLSIDELDTTNNNIIIHYSKGDDFSIEGKYIVQPYLILKGNNGSFLCDSEAFYVKKGI